MALGRFLKLNQSESWGINTEGGSIIESNFDGGLLRGKRGIMIIGNDGTNLPLSGTPFTSGNLIISNSSHSTGGPATTAVINLPLEIDTCYHLEISILASSDDGTYYGSFILHSFVRKEGVVATAEPAFQPFVISQIENGGAIGIAHDVSNPNFYFLNVTGIGGKTIDYITNVRRSQYKFK